MNDVGFGEALTWLLVACLLASVVRHLLFNDNSPDEETNDE